MPDSGVGSQRSPRARDTAGPSKPQLSIVVTIVDGVAAVRRCLEALGNQRNAPSLEVLVPFDDSVPTVASLTREFPDVHFIPMGTVPTGRPPGSAAGQHELFDRRRSAGLSAAAGVLVAIIEDRGVPESDWAAVFVSLHREHADLVIGGPIENGVDKLANWAVYFCDFGRYQLPFTFGPRDYVSDVNICYKRTALEQTRTLWQERYHETTVHWELQRNGCALQLSPTPAVYQHRTGLALGRMLSERFHWGRLFAYTRAREAGTVGRVVRATTSVLLPVVLFGRLAAGQLRRRTRLARFVAASPLICLLLVSWSAGEALGYLTGRP